MKLIPIILTLIALILIIYVAVISLENCIVYSECNPIAKMQENHNQAVQECIEYNKEHNGTYCVV